MKMQESDRGLPSKPPRTPVVEGGNPDQLPEFVKMPSTRGVEFYTGLRRGSLNQLVLPCEKNGYKPPVKSISLRKPGNARGTRLIVLASLLDYLRQLQRDQAKEGAPA